MWKEVRSKCREILFQASSDLSHPANPPKVSGDITTPTYIGHKTRAFHSGLPANVSSFLAPSCREASLPCSVNEGPSFLAEGPEISHKSVAHFVVVPRPWDKPHVVKIIPTHLNHSHKQEYQRGIDTTAGIFYPLIQAT